MGDMKLLNVTLLSAQALKDVCTFGTMSPYAKAWIDPSAKQRTPVAANAGCTPVWGHKLTLPLPLNGLDNSNSRLHIQVMNQGTAMDTILGSATIPLGDLFHSTTPNGLEFMAVQLQRPSGRLQGLVNFSVEIAAAAESLKDAEPSTSSFSMSKDLPDPGAKFLRDGVMTSRRSSVDSRAVGARRESPSSETALLVAASDALASGQVTEKLQIVEPSVREVDRIPTSVTCSPLATQSSTSWKGPERSIPIAPDALDMSRGEAGGSKQQQDNAAVDSSSVHGAGTLGKDGESAPPSFAHTMFGGVIGALLMGDAVSDSKGSVDHGGLGSHGGGHGDGGPGGDASALPGG